MPAQTVFKLRRDTAANWTSANPVLASGEPGFEVNTNKIKYGDGTTAWNSLGYAGTSVSGTLADGYVVRLDGTSGDLQSSGLVITDANIFAKPAAETQYKKAVTGSNNGTINSNGFYDRDYTFDLSLSNYFSATLTRGQGTTAPTVVATAGNVFSSSTSGTLTLPTGTAAGDIVVVGIGSDGGQPTVTSTGWTTYTSGSQGTAYLTIAIKQMGATPDTTIAFNNTSTATSAVATTYRGASISTITPVLAPTSGSGSPNPAAVTTAVNNSLVVVVGGLDDDTVSGVTAPTGYSNLAWQYQPGAFTTAMAGKVVATAGSEDPGAFTFTGGTDDWAAYTIVLEPASFEPKIIITPATAITTAAGTALSQTVILDLTYTSGVTVTWDTDINFGEAGAPLLITGTNYLVSLTTNDATNYKAVVNSGY